MFLKDNQRRNGQVNLTGSLLKHNRFLIPSSLAKIKKSGFSLVEMMMVVGMLGGLSLLVMNITKQSTKSSSKYDFDSDKTQITNEITGILSDPNKCKLNNFLGGKNPANDTTITSIGTQYYSLASTTPQPPANGYGNAGIKISSYSLSSTADDLLANTAYLVVSFQGKSILGTQGIKISKIKLNFTSDGSGKILTCNAVASGSGSQWVTLGSNIYYPDGGNVGIGTSNPTARLEVTGTFKPGSVTMPATCTVLGTQGYNATTGAPVYCNGTNWTVVGGGGGTVQTWQNVLASRALGTTYTNTTASPITVSLYGHANGGALTVNWYVNGAVVGGASLGYSTGGNYYGGGSFLVPAGATYLVQPINATGILNGWSELR